MKTSTFLLKWQQRMQKLRLVAIFALVVLCTYGLFHYLFGPPAAETRIIAALQQQRQATTGSLPSGPNPHFQEGVMDLEARRALTIEYCTSSKIFKDNGAWCLRDRKPPQEFAPGHRFSTQVGFSRGFSLSALCYVCFFRDSSSWAP
jgi:hypothetical protein